MASLKADMNTIRSYSAGTLPDVSISKDEEDKNNRIAFLIEEYFNAVISLNALMDVLVEGMD